jgi:hypothetical protein
LFDRSTTSTAGFPQTLDANDKGILLKVNKMLRLQTRMMRLLSSAHPIATLALPTIITVYSGYTALKTLA